MLVLEAKLKGKPGPFQALDEAIGTDKLIQNSYLPDCMDNHDVGKTEMFCFKTELRIVPKFPWAKSTLRI